MLRLCVYVKLVHLNNVDHLIIEFKKRIFYFLDLLHGK